MGLMKTPDYNNTWPFFTGLVIALQKSWQIALSEHV